MLDAVEMFCHAHKTGVYHVLVFMLIARLTYNVFIRESSVKKLVLIFLIGLVLSIRGVAGTDVGCHLE